MTGTFSAVGTSVVLQVLPQETLGIVLSGAGSYVFNGTIAVEVSRNGQATFETAKAVDGTELRYAGEQAADFAVDTTFKNEAPFPVYVRVRCTVFDVASDDINYAVTETTDDIVETILYDKRQRPVVQVLDNGGISIIGKLKVADTLTVAGAATLSGSVGAISPTSIALQSRVVDKSDLVTITAADIVSTSAGKFGHAAGYTLVAAPGADVAIEFVSAVAIYDYGGAGYADGGDISVNLGGGGAAQSGVVSAANFCGATADKAVVFYPLSTAAVALVANAGLSLVAATAFTNGGSATGVIRVQIRYRLHTLGL